MQFSVLSFTATALVAAALVAAQGKLTVNSNPTITLCVPNRLTWSGGSAPYNVFIIVPGQASQILDTLGQTSNDYFVYTPDGKTSGIQGGDSVAVYVTDNQGIFSASAGLPVIAGGSCSQTGSGSGSGSGSSQTSAPSSAAPSAPQSSTSLATSTSSRPSASTSNSAAAPTTSTSSGNTQPGAAAPGLKVSGGLIAGVVGLLAAALI